MEELSIGEEVGEEAYLFGRITDAWASDERIYLIDAQIPVVRAFDGSGRHLFDVGRPGQGRFIEREPYGYAYKGRMPQ